MRFIDLKVKAKDPFEQITSLACGPNFIFNRQNDFELMIKDQGVTFWFRFWLSFCLHPGCKELRKIQKRHPNMTSHANIKIHNRFLQGSDKEALKYFLEIATKLSKCPSKKMLFREKDNDEPAIDILQKCSEIAFGASICTVFHKWLVANKTTFKNQNYWSMPNEYLDVNFKPGMLEIFLVSKWEDNLLTLIDCGNKKPPEWLKILLQEIPIPIKHYLRKEETEELQYLRDYLKAYRHQKKMQIEAADEPLNKKQAEIGKLLIGKHKFERKTKNRSLGSKNGASKNTNKRQCAYCHTLEYFYMKFTKCKRCEEETWKQPRYYCSDSCLVEHWFQAHQKEHTNFNAINNNTLTTSMRFMPKA